MKTIKVYTFVLISVLTSKVHAEGFWKQTWEELISPVTQESKYYFLGGVAFTAIFATENVDKEFCDKMQSDVVHNKPLGEFSIVGDIAGQLVPNALYAGYFYWMSWKFKDDLAYKRATYMFKSTLYSSLVTNVLKYTVREKRPNSDDYTSFPSGHATSAFAFATAVAMEHEWYWGLSAMGLAGLVSYSRINDNVHHVHDVVGGAVIGAGYGLGLHYLYKDKSHFMNKVRAVPNGNGFSVVFNTKF